MTTSTAIHSDLAIPPGEYLLEAANELGISQADLARRMGRPSQAINEIIKGEKAITPETALQLEQVLGVPAHVWTGLEAEYQLVLARQQESKAVEDEIRLLEKFPYRSMTSMKWIQAVRDDMGRVKELRRFFGVASLSNLPDVKAFSPAFRQSTRLAASPEALAAWLRIGELDAREINTKPYDEGLLRQELANLRALTKDEPVKFIPQLRTSLARCGVAFVLRPHLPKTYVNGATFWITPDKAVLMMSIRGSWADIFWFSLFHEIGHILLHDKRLTFLEDHQEDLQWKRQEDEANKFAGDALIHEATYRQFVASGVLTSQAIRSCALKLGVHPGIVVGRLQHDKVIGHNHRHCKLRARYKWQN